MKLTWVNHASFVLERKGIRLISDPWIEGSVFNNSWAHISPSVFKYEDFKDITHIWFSHEHPDHFFPPNLKKIPAEYKKRITVLYQKTSDKKVIDHCRKAGFEKVIELDPLRYYSLDDEFKVMNCSVLNDTDSWLHIKTPELSLLNLNDCVFEKDKEIHFIKDHLNCPIDVLFIQFSYANWVGNKDDIEKKMKSAEKKRLDLLKTIQILTPHFVIPFASFVWFCREDNYHMNAQANTIGTIYDFIRKQSQSIPIVLYPDDKWIINSSELPDSKAAIAHYNADIKALLGEPKLIKTQCVSIQNLSSEAEAFRNKCFGLHSRLKLMRYPSFTFHLTDLHESYSFSFKTGFQKSVKTFENSDIRLTSEAMLYCFQFDWGFGTLRVSGCYEIPEKGNFDHFREYAWIAELNNQNKKLPTVAQSFRQRILKFIRPANAS